MQLLSLASAAHRPELCYAPTLAQQTPPSEFVGPATMPATHLQRTPSSNLLHPCYPRWQSMSSNHPPPLPHSYILAVPLPTGCRALPSLAPPSPHTHLVSLAELKGFEIKRRGELKLIKVWEGTGTCCQASLARQQHGRGTGLTHHNMGNQAVVLVLLVPAITFAQQVLLAACPPINLLQTQDAISPTTPHCPAVALSTPPYTTNKTTTNPCCSVNLPPASGVPGGGV